MERRSIKRRQKAIHQIEAQRRSQKTFNYRPYRCSSNGFEASRICYEELAKYSFINKGKSSFHHCHLRKGKPTYVACWAVTNENKIEVFYVGTHEGAPY